MKFYSMRKWNHNEPNRYDLLLAIILINDLRFNNLREDANTRLRTIIITKFKVQFKFKSTVTILKIMTPIIKTNKVPKNFRLILNLKIRCTKYTCSKPDINCVDMLAIAEPIASIWGIRMKLRIIFKAIPPAAIKFNVRRFPLAVSKVPKT